MEVVIDDGVGELLDEEQQEIESEDLEAASPEVQTNWARSVPRMLYRPKTNALQLNSNIGTSSPSSSSGSALKKRTIAGEMEYAKVSKRRRPTLPSDDVTVQLTAARLELVLQSKQQLAERAKREEERQKAELERQQRMEERENALFEVDLKKKQLEAEALELQVMQQKRDLGLL